MLRPRIIPCLLVKDKGLVKTVKFSSPRYVGDPVNAVRIFNEKEVDELMVLDIDATRESRDPDFKSIAYLAAECQMPLCYGGGVKAPEQVERIVRLGVEKVAMSTAAIENPDVINVSAEVVGSQSVVVVLDVKKNHSSGKYEVWTRNAQRNTHRTAVEVAAEMQERGAGEIVVNSIDNDGTMTGYDLELLDEVRGVISVPITILGGAGSVADLAMLAGRYGTLGIAAGSLFVFKGPRKAVLINYPSRSQRDALLCNSGRRDV
ncbi:MAG: imidazole glycerol phosphate synthase subunit HisF [Deltaproteobacteria bacterium]|nr:imidazole glycerol phosphate synthase subunit HisF [Deltaproteobacteria bacterium]